MKRLGIFLKELTMLKIKIIKSSDSLLWYTKHIGETFEVFRETPEAYWSREKNQFRAMNWIAREDAEVVTSDDLKGNHDN